MLSVHKSVSADDHRTTARQDRGIVPGADQYSGVGVVDRVRAGEKVDQFALTDVTDGADRIGRHC
jgi:hypothetical protein